MEPMIKMIWIHSFIDLKAHFTGWELRLVMMTGDMLRLTILIKGKHIQNKNMMVFLQFILENLNN